MFMKKSMKKNHKKFMKRFPKMSLKKCKEKLIKKLTKIFMKKIYEKIQEKYWICHEKYIFAFPDFPRFFWWNYIWLLLRAVQKLTCFHDFFSWNVVDFFKHCGLEWHRKKCHVVALKTRWESWCMHYLDVLFQEEKRHKK